MAFTKITSAGIGTTETVTLDGLSVINNESIGGNLTVTGNATIGGVLTYEDVTNVDSVGLITARNGIVVGSGITLSKDGDVFFTGIATGNGSGLTALNASNLASGTVPTARLGSGTASSSTFLRGDSSFQTITTDLVGDTSPQLGGNLDVNTKNILFGDSSDGSSDDTLIFGAGSDLKMYHSGDHSFIKHVGTGNFYISCDNEAQIVLRPKLNEAGIVVKPNGAVELYEDNTKRFETTSTGAKISGSGATFETTSTGAKLSGTGVTYLEINTTDGSVNPMVRQTNGDRTFDTGLRGDSSDAWCVYDVTASDNRFMIDTSGNVLIPNDSAELRIGAGSDLLLYHDGTTNYIKSDNGNMAFRVANGNRLEINGTSGNVIMQGSGGKNFEWKNSDAYLNLNDSTLLTCGTDNDLQIGHNNSDSNILHNGTGDLYIGTGGAGERLFFQTAGNAVWRMNPGGALKAGTHIDGGDGSHGDTYHMHITANFGGSGKACLLLEDYSYYSDSEALCINNADSNSGRNMEDVQFRREDTLVGYIRIHSSSTTYSTSGSDRRLKKNFEDWTEDNLSKFKTLSPQLFNWNTEEDGAAKTKGFIAQDNLEKFPEAYPLTTTNDRYYFNPSGMVHYLMKAMKEAAIKIETLEAEVAALKSS